MNEDRRDDSSVPHHDRTEPAAPLGRSGGSFIIFLLVAMALLLAIGFFYMSEDLNNGPADALTNGVEESDSAARVVGNAAQNAANLIRNRN